ncbi:putative sterigmatocystin 8-O-methyltransferase [Rosellinia necatrix]|uniref:Putative sterigmatocystin 8-O-methyltransferase n=1 Tax=Rosellinia necatrix TaxID=77044 RepID=A0A1W2TBP6_ROSNE|nr:putative sterigmatocystin 8-O-methyltransferase [Rosellinia necatrix]
MSDPQSLPRFLQLAQIISSSTAVLHRILLAHSAPFPSFDGGGAFYMPKEASEAQDALIDATAELHDLLLDPMNLLLSHGGHTNMIPLQAITRFKIASMIPENGQASYEDIARQTCLSEPVLRRILQAAMSMRVFRELEPGMVAHTKASRLFVDPQWNDWMSNHAEEGWPAAVKMVDALEKWPKSQEPNESGFSLANNTSDSIYNVISSDPRRAQRFANYMKANASSYDYDATHVIANYDWESLGTATVVDVGGSQGHVAMQLATRFRNLSIVVQDIESVVADAETRVPDELKGRVRFEAHDFFQPQATAADVFFLRLILHNWTDKYSVLILRALIPALRHGARVIIVDVCMKERGVLPLWKEKAVRRVDMMMGSLLNARERTHAEWRALLGDADARFNLKEVIEPHESSLAVIDVRWDDPMSP